MPAGWSQGLTSHHPTNPGWVFDDVYVGSEWNSYVATHTYVAYIDDADYNYPLSVNYDTLYTPSMNCSANAHVSVSLDLSFENFLGGEVGTIAVSTDGGATWTTAITLPGLLNNPAWQDSLVYDISTYAAGQANVKLAFTWNNYVNVTSNSWLGWGMAVDNIDVFEPLNYSLAVTSITTPYLFTAGNTATFTGTIFNWGGDAITSMHLNYTVDGGPVQTDNITGIAGFNSLTSYNFSHNIPHIFSATGNYKVKIWVDNLNGVNADQSPQLDTLYAYFTVVSALQTKTVQLEEFMHASCNPCMYASPNLDGVITSAGSILNPVRYHVNWGPDYMGDETDTPFVDLREAYYDVFEVPNARIDGTTNVDPASLTLSDITQAQSIGSPFTINITSCTYNLHTNTYNVQASIKSYSDIPDSVTAMVVLSSDTIKYDTDQGTEDPITSFTPPLGTGANPDSYYQYVMNFPNVAEDMMSGPPGSPLSHFTSGQTKTINFTWKKNHPWGAEAQTYKYDSLGDHITIFLQENNVAPKTGSPAHSPSGAIPQYIYQSASAPVTITTGIEELAKGIYFTIYPNPANSDATIQFSLDNEQNVTVELYNMLGRKGLQPIPG